MVIGTFPHAGDLAPGASVTVTQSVILPNGIAGTRFAGVLADSGSVVIDPDRSNNLRFSTAALSINASDLVASGLAATNRLTLGVSATVSWHVGNDGVSDTRTPTVDAVFASPAADSLRGAVLLGTFAAEVVKSGGGYDRTVSLTVPLRPDLLPPGSYFLVVVADANNNQAEANEDNNRVSIPVAVQLPPLPDLAAEGVVAPQFGASGAGVEVVWTVRNAGNLAAAGAWNERPVLRGPAGSALRLADLRFTNDIPAGSSLVRTQTVVLPPSLAAGTYTLAIQLDPDGELVESTVANNSAASAGGTVIPAALRVDIDPGQVLEGGPAAIGTVTRNSDTLAPLLVTLANPLPSELNVPATVEIPAGAASATFEVKAPLDGVTDGSRVVTLKASAPSHADALGSVATLDVDQPRIAIELSADHVTEGLTLPVTLRRTGPPTGIALVLLRSSDSGRLQVPEVVAIPDGSSTMSFALIAPDDTLIQVPLSVQLTAISGGYVGTTNQVTVIDNDFPAIAVTATTTNLNENAGPQAATITFTRSGDTGRPVVMDLIPTVPGLLLLPDTATIAAGATAVSVPVGVVDDNLVNGRRLVGIRTFVRVTGRLESAGEAPVLDFAVQDDEGPSLALVLGADLAPEGRSPAFTATLKRNSGTDKALVVSLASSKTTEATVPATVTFPVGAASVSFPVATLNDGVTDGSQTVTVSATAGGFSPASASFVVSDANLPDLAVTRVTVAASGDTEAPFNVSYRVENRGNANAVGPFVTRLFLSGDPVPGGDSLLGQFVFDGTMAAGQFFEQTAQFRLPRQTGRYWVVAITDAGQSVAEIREDNNVTVSAAPIEAKAAYIATVVADRRQAVPGTPIPMHGRVVRPGSDQGVPNAVVNVHVLLRGTRRIVTAAADASGNFTATFQPLPSEAGRYDIGAAHPGEPAAPVQDHFDILGFAVVPNAASVSMNLGDTDATSVRLVNLSDIPLTGLKATTVAAPGNLEVGLEIDNATLGGGSTNTVVLRAKATAATTTFGTFGLRISSTEGPVSEIPVSYNIRVPAPKLVADPGTLVAGMTRGRQVSVAFDIVNLGGATAEPIVVSLPDLPWLAVAGDNPLPALPPGRTNRITLLLTPPADLPLGPYVGAIALNGANASLSVPFEFRALSDALGSLLVRVEDEFTYYAEGAPRVTNATVVVRDTFSKAVVTNGVTDAKGEFYVPSLPEAYYQIEVSAEKHTTDRNDKLVVAGHPNVHTAFISRQTVEYNWTVVPTEIEDHTQIIIETTFETVVPIPVVTIEPSFIDLVDMVGDEMQVDVAISNHGLIAAQEMRIDFGTHPDFTFTPLISDIGTLPAESSLVIPVTIRRVTPPVARASLSASGIARPAAGTSPCWAGGTVQHKLKCGAKKNNYSTPISIRTSVSCGGNTSGSNSGWGGGGGGGYGGGGGVGSGGGSAGGFATKPTVSPKEPCDCNERGFVPRCLEIGASGGLFGSAVGTAASAFLSPFNGNAEFKINGNVKVCTCCDEEGEDYKLEGTIEGEAALTVAIPLVGKRIRQGRAEAGGMVFLDAGIGCDLTIAGKIKLTGTGSTECHFANPKFCVTVTAEIPAAVVCGAAAKLTLEVPGEPDVSQGASATVGLTAGVSGSISICSDKSSGKVCLSAVNAEANASAAIGALTIGGKFTQELIPEKCKVFGGTADLAGEPEYVRDIVRQMMAAAENFRAQHEARYTPHAAVASSARAASRVRSAAKAEEAGICAQVKLRLEQDLVLTRNAFNATLELINKDPLARVENLAVSVQVYDMDGHAVTDSFGFRPPVLNGLDAVDGTGTLPPNSRGTASFVLVPTRDAAPDAPRQYGVGGFLTYRLDGRTVSVPLAPVTITVLPDPLLVVQYFHQRDVFSDDPFTHDVIEPTVPFNLGVLVANHGHGEAKNVRIVSGQPEIVENEKGLAIEFKIIATEVDGKGISPSLTADFGRVAPGGIGIARWLMTSTLQGLFLDYSATFQHVDSLGKTNLSLVDAVSIHELIHLVEAGGPFADGRHDFLVNDDPDADHLPDTLYLSDGRTNAVAAVLSAQADGVLAGANRRIQLNAALPKGWAYLKVPDPADGKFTLRRVTRSDGVEIAVGTNVWVTDRTFRGGGKRPVYENVLHLFDHDGTGSYTLEYEDLPSIDNSPPTSSVAALPAASYPVMPLLWSGGDEPGGSGLAGFDIFVSVDGGPFGPWLQNTKLRGAVYRGEPGHAYAFYSVAFDTAGNREAPPLQPDAGTTTSLANNAPAIADIPTVAIDEGQIAVVEPTATDADLPAQTLTWMLGADAPRGAVIDASTGRVTWETGEATGPSTNRFDIVVRDSGVPALFATNRATVVVREVNAAPTLAAINDATISENQLLVVNLAGADSDLPPQTLSYSFVGVPPAGATIDGSKGILRWRPNNVQGGRAYAIGVRVTDGGVPPLSADRFLKVTVRDTQGDFSVTLGRTNLYRGNASSVAIDLESPLDLVGLRFGLSVPVTALDQLSLAPLAPELATATILPDGPDHSRLEFTSVAGSTFVGSARLARLQFHAPDGTASLKVPLEPDSTVGVKPDGSTIANPRVVPGRVVVIGEQPVLDLGWNGAAPLLQVYGRTGVQYRLETAVVLAADAVWTPIGTIRMDADVQAVPFAPDNADLRFIRGLRLP